YMVRGHPLGNETMMAEGYERGFGFLSGCAIDQHFTQRHRERDLASVIVRFPQLLGIGLDEGTAIVVQESVATVLGAHAAHFLDHGVAHGDASVPPTKVAAGARYDLAARKLLGK
ncbi:MAG: cyanophycinase, partial [Candidatus Methylomirabilis sp.]|nr:cyanophycinase [Deltaproteobacteria bacterium]